MLKNLAILLMLVALAAVVGLGCKSSKKKNGAPSGTGTPSVSGALPIDVEVVTLTQALGSVCEIAREHQLSVYDASYVELARRMALALATLDRRLAAVATDLGVSLFTSPT